MKLFLLQVGQVRPPQQAEDAIFPVPAYLIETDTGEHLLIDIGLSHHLIGAYRSQPTLSHILDAVTASKHISRLLARWSQLFSWRKGGQER